MRLATAAGLAGLLAATAAAAQDPTEFYRNGTIRLVIGLPAGASYDDIGRLVARHLGAHIPGRPRVVAENMPGATGRVAASYIFNTAPKDGSVLGALHESIALAQAVGESGVRYDARQLGWIGSPVEPDDVLTLWHSAGIRSIAEARAKEVVLGATTTAANNFIHPTLANNLLGTRFRIVVGYQGGNAVDLAMERGEVQGRGSNPWNTWKAEHADWIRDGKLVPLLQMGLEKHPDLAAVPRFIDLAIDERTRAVIKLVAASAGIARPIAAPPGVPAERIALLRRAFAAMVQDAAFAADTARLHEEVRPVSGEELTARVREIIDAPPAAIALLKQSMAGQSVACKSVSDAKNCAGD
jgi:tripartite-type tricarboxylate transporter receptor subunit TctC